MGLLSIFSSKKSAKQTTEKPLISPESEAEIEKIAEQMAKEMPDNYSIEDFKLTSAYMIARMSFLEEILRITIAELKTVQQDISSNKK